MSALEEPEEGSANLAGARFFRALGDPTRLAIVRCLLVRPLSVSELTDKLAVPQSRVSNHLACLRWCRLVTPERQGRRMIYSIADDRLRKLLTVATDMVGENEEHLATVQRSGPDWV